MTVVNCIPGRNRASTIKINLVTQEALDAANAGSDHQACITILMRSNRYGDRGALLEVNEAERLCQSLANKVHEIRGDQENKE